MIQRPTCASWPLTSTPTDRPRALAIVRYPRLAGAVLAVAGGAVLALTLRVPASVWPIAILVPPIVTTLSALSPSFLSRALKRSGPPSDFYQWRWGVVAGGVTTAVLAATMPMPAQGPALASVVLLGLYIAGKVGCAQYGCCGAVPFRVASAHNSLPHAEIRVSAASLFVAVVCVCSGEPRLATAIAVAAHIVVRAMSYWARGERVHSRGLLRMPDLVALPALLLGLVLS